MISTKSIHTPVWISVWLILSVSVWLWVGFARISCECFHFHKILLLSFCFNIINVLLWFREERLGRSPSAGRLIACDGRKKENKISFDHWANVTVWNSLILRPPVSIGIKSPFYHPTQVIVTLTGTNWSPWYSATYRFRVLSGFWRIHLSNCYYKQHSVRIFFSFEPFSFHTSVQISRCRCNKFRGHWHL